MTDLQKQFDEHYERFEFALNRLEYAVGALEEETGKQFYKSQDNRITPWEIHNYFDDIFTLEKNRVRKLLELKPAFESPRRYFFDFAEINNICGARRK